MSEKTGNPNSRIHPGRRLLHPPPAPSRPAPLAAKAAIPPQVGETCSPPLWMSNNIPLLPRIDHLARLKSAFVLVPKTPVTSFDGQGGARKPEPGADGFEALNDPRISGVSSEHSDRACGQSAKPLDQLFGGGTSLPISITLPLSPESSNSGLSSNPRVPFGEQWEGTPGSYSQDFLAPSNPRFKARRFNSSVPFGTRARTTSRRDPSEATPVKPISAPRATIFATIPSARLVGQFGDGNRIEPRLKREVFDLGAVQDRTPSSFSESKNLYHGSLIHG